MPVVDVAARLADERADRAFDTVADFSRYPELVVAVRSVRVGPTAADGSVSSHWEVMFRNGVLRWTETDRLDRAAGSIRFEQVSGDFDVFRGYWSIVQDGADVLVSLRTEFDFGVPSMASIIDPVAARVLVETTVAIMRGLFGDRLDILPTEQQVDAEVRPTPPVCGDERRLP